MIISRKKYIANNLYITNYGLIGEIDLININDEYIEIKCVSQINLKHVLQLLMYNLMKSNEFRDIELKKSGKDKIITRQVLQMMFDRYEPPTEEEGFDRVTEIDVNSRLSKIK